MAVLDERLQCEVNSLSYDFNMRRGTVDIADAHSADGDGTLALFTAIDGSVTEILITVAGTANTVYRKRNGGWETSLLG
jgi:hypothetical protein